MSKFFVFFSSIFLYIIISSVFFVHEGENSIVLRFGKILKNNHKETIVYKPGYHFKWPILDTVTTLDVRIQTFNNEEDHFVTKDKKELIVNVYVKWRIHDLNRYYLSTQGGNIFQTESILKRQCDNQLRSKISMLNAKEIISDTHETLIKNLLDTLNEHPINMNDLSLKNQNILFKLGVEIVDIRIIHISLPVKIRNMIYNRMRLEQKYILEHYFSEGEKESERLRIAADHQRSIILAEAHKKALIIHGESEAIVKQLFLNNFSDVSNFYFFIRTANTYKHSWKNDKNMHYINLDSLFYI